jgi:hypothetical protein
MVADTLTSVPGSTYPLYVDHPRGPRGAARHQPGEPLLVDELPLRNDRALLLGESGTGKTIALHRMAAYLGAAHGGEADTGLQPRYVHLDGTRSLGSLLGEAPDREHSIFLIDGLERLDTQVRSRALDELRTLAAGDPTLRYAVALRPTHRPEGLPGQAFRLRPRTPAQIEHRLREVAGDKLASKVLADSAELIFDLGRNPLYLAVLLEVLLGFGNLPRTRARLLEALVDSRLDRAVSRGLSHEAAWQIRESLGQIAWGLITSVAGTHRVPRSQVLEAFPGEGADELKAVLQTGLLREAPGDRVMFTTTEFESWFAALELARRVSYTGSADFVPATRSRVHDAVVLATAKLDEAGALVRHCLRQGQDLLVAHCLRASPEQESEEFVRAFLGRLATGLEPRATSEVREASLAALAIVNTPASRRHVAEQLRAAVRPGKRAGRDESATAALRRLPGRLGQFVTPLRVVPPSTQRAILGELLSGGREREILASAHLHRMLDLDLDADTVAVLEQHLHRSEGNRSLHMLLEALGPGVVGRSLDHLLESLAFIRNPFPLGRLLRQGRAPEAEAALRDAFDSPDERVRQVAVFVYVAEGDEAALGEIEASAASGHGHRRWFAAAALEGVPGSEPLRILQELASDRNDRVSKQAKTSLRACERRTRWEELQPKLEHLDQHASIEEVGQLMDQVLGLGASRYVDRALGLLPDEARSRLHAFLRDSLCAEAKSPASRSARRILIGLPEAEQRRILGDRDVARRILAAPPREFLEKRGALLQMAVETVLAGELAAREIQVPLVANHQGIEGAIDLLAELGWPPTAGGKGTELPTAGELLTGQLGAKAGAVCEVLRKRVLQQEPPPPESSLPGNLDSLARLGGSRELLRVVSDQRFGRGIGNPLREALARLRVIPRKGALPEPLLSLAARRALDWFGRGGRGPGRFPESPVEVQLDPWPYLWFRRFAGANQKHQLGQALARVIGEDTDLERRERNLRLLRKLDGGLIPRAYEAAGLEPPPRPGRKSESTAPRARPAPPAAEAPPDATPVEEEGPPLPMPPPVATRPKVTAVAPPKASPAAAPAPPVTPAAPPAEPPPRPGELEQVRSWWAARTAPADSGAKTQRRARKGSNQKIRDLINQVVAGELEGDLEPGVLSGLLALAPALEDAELLRGAADLRQALEADVRRTDEPWARESLRRLEQP